MIPLPPSLRGSHVPAAAGNADMSLQAECASMRGPVLPQLRPESKADRTRPVTHNTPPCAHVPHRTGSSTLRGARRRQGACTGRFTRSACTACGVAGTHTCASLSVIASASLSSSVAILAFSIALFLKSTVAIVAGQPSTLGRSFLRPHFPPVCPPSCLRRRKTGGFSAKAWKKETLWVYPQLRVHSDSYQNLGIPFRI